MLASEPAQASVSAMATGDGTCTVAYKYVLMSTYPLSLGNMAAAITGSTSHQLRKLRKKDETQL